MFEEVGKEIGNKVGQTIEVDKRSWQDDQAKFMRIKVGLPIDNSLRRGGGILLMWKGKGLGSRSSTNNYPPLALPMELWGMTTSTTK